MTASPTVRDSVAIADPSSPAHVLKPNADGSLPVALTGAGNTVAIDQTTPGTTNGVQLKAGSALAGKFSIDQVTAGANTVTLARNGLATYIASGTGFSAYGTPTDIITIRGSATKKVAIILASWKVWSTAGALITVYWTRRSAVDTGGSSANPVAIPLDSTDAAATAQINLYTAAPTLGAAVGILNVQRVLSTVVNTTVPGIFSFNSVLTLANQANQLIKPLTLNNENEMLCLSLSATSSAGPALPGGITSDWDFTWVEY